MTSCRKPHIIDIKLHTRLTTPAGARVEEFLRIFFILLRKFNFPSTCKLWLEFQFQFGSLQAIHSSPRHIATLRWVFSTLAEDVYILYPTKQNHQHTTGQRDSWTDECEEILISLFHFHLKCLASTLLHSFQTCTSDITMAALTRQSQCLCQKKVKYKIKQRRNLLYTENYTGKAWEMWTRKRTDMKWPRLRHHRELSSLCTVVCRRANLPTYN